MPTFFPDKESFVKTYTKGEAQYVACNITADILTPVSAMRAIEQAKLSDYRLLFESVEGGEVRGRYSVIALKPDALWECIEGTPKIKHGDDWKEDGEDIFASLTRFVQDAYINPGNEIPPMLTGVFGFMGYDMVQYMEPVLTFTNPDTIEMPESLYMRPSLMVVFDSVKGEALVVTPVRPDEKTAEEAYAHAEKDLSELIKVLESPDTQQKEKTSDVHISLRTHTEKEAFMATVEKAKEYILAGDVFQVVPSRRFSADYAGSPFAFYRSLRRINPSPYLFYVVLGDAHLIGSSPEILVKVIDDTVTIRPLAGTRMRGKNAKEDDALAAELLADEKEKAEHLMLLDLGRNDVGRVAKPANVTVTEDFKVEKYSHVMHIVSNVEGALDPEKGFQAIDALKGGFPAGTVSGAPKIRAMEVIEELENEKRSFYAGTVGYISAHGETGLMDTCITLRTALIKNNTLTLQAGAGIVYDSDPESEWDETENKARALMRAAEQAYDYE